MLLRQCTDLAGGRTARAWLPLQAPRHRSDKVPARQAPLTPARRALGSRTGFLGRLVISNLSEPERRIFATQLYPAPPQPAPSQAKPVEIVREVVKEVIKEARACPPPPRRSS